MSLVNLRDFNGIITFFHFIKSAIFRIRLQKALLSNLFLFIGLVLSKFNGLDLLYVLLFLSLLFAQIFTFLINDFFDREYDKFSEKKRLRNIFCNESQNIRVVVLILTICCGIISLFLALIIDGLIFFLTMIYVLITLQYSSPPLRIKDHPPFDVIVHGLALAIVGITGFVYFFPYNELFLYVFVLGFLLGVIPQIGQQVNDYAIDKVSEQKTSTTKLGRSRTKILLRLLVGFTIFWLILMTFTFSQQNFLLIGLILFILTILYIIAEDYKKERIYLALQVGITLFLL